MSFMTHAFNALKSTLKANPTAMELYAGAVKAGEGMSSMFKADSLSSLKGAGSLMNSQFKQASNLQKAGMIGTGMGAGMGGAAALDFFNPWGLGWGD